MGVLVRKLTTMPWDFQGRLHDSCAAEASVVILAYSDAESVEMAVCAVARALVETALRLELC